MISPTEERAVLERLYEAVQPFVSIIANTSGRIPHELLSFENWHTLCKAFNAATPVITLKLEPKYVLVPRELAASICQSLEWVPGEAGSIAYENLRAFKRLIQAARGGE